MALAWALGDSADVIPNGLSALPYYCSVSVELTGRKTYSIDTGVVAMVDRLTGQLSRSDDLTEALKAADPLAWVGRVNSIQARVREMITAELICK